MPLQRSEKEAIVKEVAERLEEAEAVVFTDYRGLDVAQITELRRQLREAGAQYRVVKNTLLRRAFAAAGLELPEAMLEGPTALALLHDDLSEPAKALRVAAKATDILKVKGGLMGGRQLDQAAVFALADLPTRDELRAMFLSMLQQPMSQFVGLLQAPQRNLLNVLNARVEAGEETAG